MNFAILKRTKSGKPFVDVTLYVGYSLLSVFSHLSCDGPIVSRCALMPFLRGEFDFECFMIIYGNQEQLRNEYVFFILVALSLLGENTNSGPLRNEYVFFILVVDVFLNICLPLNKI